MLKIISVPDKTLTQPTKKVTKIDKKILSLVAKMEQTLSAQKDPEGVGLAAPQVGENIALFIIKPSKKSKTEVFINPKIVKISQSQSSPKSAGSVKSGKSTKTKLEGCLSIPRIWGSIKRADKILLQYQTLTSEIKKKWFQGFEALIIQHEIDHLQGVLFTQRALEQNRPLFEEKEGKLEKLELVK